MATPEWDKGFGSRHVRGDYKTLMRLSGVDRPADHICGEPAFHRTLKWIAGFLKICFRKEAATFDRWIACEVMESDCGLNLR
jgi:hypothetical protein